ncbi:hypothetical protein CDL12_13117 [Handroanthus impetiginosus]|uniref:F-box domain-containing protein n=1 Tax=Handroanthus impetiginosus TaxID=429701 RepID=A0A2G9H9S2_9LAMI|nr:hypothetical protein CDL12_13117 [Handroanthus impetiginosus]
MGSKKIDEPQQILPPEIIFEILSWLPLKSLSQMQLVCKAWQELIYDHHFIGKHMNHSNVVCYWHNVTVSSDYRQSPPKSDSFSYVHGCDGLVLLKNNSKHKYCLWNPAVRRVLELPDPHGHNHGFALSFVPSTGRYKIVAIYSDEESGALSCEVLTPGHSKMWRHLTFPDINANRQRKTEKVSLISTGGVDHCVLVLSDGKEIIREIVSLDLEAECFTVNHLPKGLFDDWETVWDLEWNGKLAFAVIIEQNLEVMILEDYKKGRWSLKKKAIRLTFLEKYKYPQENIFPLFAKNGDIWFWLKNEKILEYTIETGQIAHVIRSEAFSPENKLYVYKPSLITFEGMQPDTNMAKLRPPKFDRLFDRLS